jgi:UDPglucose 6-dehydrogenase
MFVQIIGAGTVGLATGEGLERLGHYISYYDINKNKLDEMKGKGYNTSFTINKSSDVTFICVPEWEVYNVIEKIHKINNIIVIRSTVEPGTTESLMKEFKCHIIHNPEFLKEATALWDFMNPDRIVLGECCKKHGDILEEIYKPLRTPIIRLSPTESEMVKLSSNAYLSTLISYWNEIYNICEYLDINSHKIGLISSLDNRISRYGASMHGKPFGGFCLPKDLETLISFAKKVGYFPDLLEAVKKINKDMNK